jgi:hypothetical protein
MPQYGRFAHLDEAWDPVGLALNGSDELFVFADLFIDDLSGALIGFQGLMRVDLVTGIGSLVALGDTGSFPWDRFIQSFVMGPDGLLYLSAPVGSQPGIYRIDPVTGAQSLFVAGLTGELASDGASLLLATGDSLLSLDTTTGAQTTLFSGPAFANLTSLAIVPASVPEPACAVLAGLAVLGLRGRAPRCEAPR